MRKITHSPKQVVMTVIRQDTFGVDGLSLDELNAFSLVIGKTCGFERMKYMSREQSDFISDMYVAMRDMIDKQEAK